MAKNNRSGQAKVLTDSEFSRIRKQLKKDRDRLLFDILRYTGERIGAVVQLRQWDCYSINGEVLETITFRRLTRKATAQGKRYTRQLIIHPALIETLESYPRRSGNPWLFPSRTDASEEHISIQGADYLLRAAVDRAGLGGKGISSHSFRRTLITRLDEAGISIKTIQGVTGHRSLASVQRYIEVSDERIRQAISLI
jgi:integrase/recombinase XerD